MKLLLSVFLLFPILLCSQSFEKGEKLFLDGKYNQALPVFENCLKSNPSNLKTIEYLGDIAGHQRKWDNALFYYKKIKNQFPKNANYQYKYGGALAMKAKEVNKFTALTMIGDIKLAFETAAKLDSKHVDTRWALVMLYLELPGIVGGSEAKARKYSNELLLISPVDGYLSKGYIAEYFNRYKESEKQYLKAIEVGQSKTTYQKLADLYKNKMNLPEKAKQILETYAQKKG
jgi:tetratricopeptide (TPR) repeat protein